VRLASAGPPSAPRSRRNTEGGYGGPPAAWRRRTTTSGRGGTGDSQAGRLRRLSLPASAAPPSPSKTSAPAAAYMRLHAAGWRRCLLRLLLLSLLLL
jgi:hypothetical protein